MFAPFLLKFAGGPELTGALRRSKCLNIDQEHGALLVLGMNSFCLLLFAFCLLSDREVKSLTAGEALPLSVETDTDMMLSSLFITLCA